MVQVKMKARVLSKRPIEFRSSCVIPQDTLSTVREKNKGKSPQLAKLQSILSTVVLHFWFAQTLSILSRIFIMRETMFDVFSLTVNVVQSISWLLIQKYLGVNRGAEWFTLVGLAAFNFMVFQAVITEFSTNTYSVVGPFLSIIKRLQCEHAWDFSSSANVITIFTTLYTNLALVAASAIVIHKATTEGNYCCVRLAKLNGYLKFLCLIYTIVMSGILFFSTHSNEELSKCSVKLLKLLDRDIISLECTTTIINISAYFMFLIAGLNAAYCKRPDVAGVAHSCVEKVEAGCVEKALLGGSCLGCLYCNISCHNMLEERVDKHGIATVYTHTDMLPYMGYTLYGKTVVRSKDLLILAADRIANKFNYTSLSISLTVWDLNQNLDHIATAQRRCLGLIAEHGSLEDQKARNGSTTKNPNEQWRDVRSGYWLGCRKSSDFFDRIFKSQNLRTPDD